MLKLFFFWWIYWFVGDTKIAFEVFEITVFLAYDYLLQVKITDDLDLSLLHLVKVNK